MRGTALGDPPKKEKQETRGQAGKDDARNRHRPGPSWPCSRWVGRRCVASYTSPPASPSMQRAKRPPVAPPASKRGAEGWGACGVRLGT